MLNELSDFDQKNPNISNRAKSPYNYVVGERKNVTRPTKPKGMFPYQGRVHTLREHG